MKAPVVLSIAVLLGALAVQAHGAQPCTNEANCAQVSVGTPSAAPGGTAVVPVSFRQGNGVGIGEIAAVAFTITMPSGTPPPLTLADCTPSGDDSSRPNAAQPDPAISNFKVVIENAYCTASRTHCLCPGSGSGINPDSFINVVVYGPNPLPPPGPSPVVIPTLPLNGQLFTLALRVGAAIQPGSLTLHVLNQVDDTAASKPPYTALLSVGDKNAVDQTCGTDVPPCSNLSSVSQVVASSGSVTVKTTSCVGDCNVDDVVTVNEVLTMVNIALGSGDPGLCTPGDQNHDGSITVDEIVTAVDNALNGCPAP